MGIGYLTEKRRQNAVIVDGSATKAPDSFGKP